MRIVVVADTHIPDRAAALPRPLLGALGRVDLILHAGDVTTEAILAELARYAPVRVAMGNNDRASVRRFGARDTQVVEAEGLRIGLVHDAGPRLGRGRRMRRQFAGVDLVVFGHSHIPLDVVDDGMRLFNPGSATWKRMQAAPTYGVLEIDGGRVRAEIVPL